MAKGYAALAQRVRQPPMSEIVRINDEDVVVEIAVSWEDEKRGILRVGATAYGPSTWMTQRLDEWFVIGPADAVRA